MHVVVSRRDRANLLALIAAADSEVIQRQRVDARGRLAARRLRRQLRQPALDGLPGFLQRGLVARKVLQRLRRDALAVVAGLQQFLLGRRGATGAHGIPGHDVVTKHRNAHGHLELEEPAAIIRAQLNALAIGALQLERVLRAVHIVEEAQSQRALDHVVARHHFQQGALHARPVFAQRRQLGGQLHQAAAGGRVGVTHRRKHCSRGRVIGQDIVRPQPPSPAQPAAAEQIEPPRLALVPERTREHERRQLTGQLDLHQGQTGQPRIERVRLARFVTVVLQLLARHIHHDIVGVACATGRRHGGPGLQRAHTPMRGAQIETAWRMVVRDQRGLVLYA